MLNRLLDNYLPLAGVRLNAVTNQDLAATGPDRSSRSISNEHDRQLLVHLRGQSTLVVTDAATAQAERYRASKIVDIEIWSRTGNFRGFENQAETSASRSVRTLQLEDPLLRLNQLRLQGQRVLLETGPTLTRQIAQLNVVDEVCLTVTGVGSIADGERLAREWLTLMRFANLRLISSLEVEGTLFTRFQPENGVA